MGDIRDFFHSYLYSISAKTVENLGIKIEELESENKQLKTEVERLKAELPLKRLKAIFDCMDIIAQYRDRFSKGLPIFDVLCSAENMLERLTKEK